MLVTSVWSKMNSWRNLAGRNILDLENQMIGIFRRLPDKKNMMKYDLNNTWKSMAPKHPKAMKLMRKLHSWCDGPRYLHPLHAHLEPLELWNMAPTTKTNWCHLRPRCWDLVSSWQQTTVISRSIPLTCSTKVSLNWDHASFATHEHASYESLWITLFWV